MAYKHGIEDDTRANQEHRSTGRERSPPPPYAPPVPPGDEDHLEANDAADKTLFHSQPTTFSWSDQDPRSTSTESLVPEGQSFGKRTLLLIYIHGFMGDETSFQSFPAHVHNVVTPLLQDTHLVHTKIYPRYRSRKAIQNTRDDFSKWLEPHESANTDIILCGHSMGGLVSGEVVLLRPADPYGPKTFQHRILGTINFDVPFLGMHPGVVVSGIGSLFRPAPKSPAITASDPADQPAGASNSDAQDGMNRVPPGPNVRLSNNTSTSSLSVPQQDPNFNPSYNNDVNLPVRTGWDNAMHFITKHSDGLTRATRSYVTSHLEFGGAMADYPALHARYKALRALEDVREGGSRPRLDRVRFINYYTASTGIPKQPKRKDPEIAPTGPLQRSDQPPSPGGTVESPQVSKAIVPVEHATSNEGSEDETFTEPNEQGHTRENVDLERLSLVEPMPIDHNEPIATPSEVATHQLEPSLSAENHEGATKTSPKDGFVPEEAVKEDSFPDLPPLAPVPEHPSAFDPAEYTDKDARNLAAKEHERAMQAYNRALKDREKAIKERQKILDKREKKLQKQEKDAQKKQEEAEKKMQKQEQDAQKKQEEAEKKALKEEKTRLKQEEKQRKAQEKSKRTESMSQTTESKAGKGYKEKKFCFLPPRDSQGQRDSAWVPIHMEGVDEVIAHCGLFDANRGHYEEFVLLVGDRIQAWVVEDRL